MSYLVAIVAWELARRSGLLNWLAEGAGELFRGQRYRLLKAERERARQEREIRADRIAWIKRSRAQDELAAGAGSGRIVANRASARTGDLTR